MKVTYIVKNKNLKFEFEAENHQAVWKELSQIQELYDDMTCKKFDMETDNVRFVVRHDAEENDYFELRAMEPGKLYGCRKKFGVTKKEKALFPKLKDENNEYYPDGGWRKWDKTQQKEI